MVPRKKVCLDKTFPLGHFMLHFIMFLIRQMTTKASNEYFIVCQIIITVKKIIECYIRKQNSLY